MLKAVPIGEPSTIQASIRSLQDSGICQKFFWASVYVTSDLWHAAATKSEKPNLRIIVALLVASSFGLTYFVTWRRASLALKNSEHGRRPPLLPYWIPFLGSLLSYFWDGPHVAARLIEKFGQNVPAGLHLGPVKMYLAGNPNDAKIFFKSTPGLASNPGVAFAMKNVLGTPAHTVPLYAEDDSGQLAVPIPGSKTPKEHRIRYFHSRAAHHYLAGMNGIQIGERYMEILSRNMKRDVSLGSEWTKMVDLSLFVQNLVFPAATESICGSALLALNPNLTEDFWTFERSIPTLLKQLPRWLAPRAHRSRDKMLGTIKTWHAYAKERTDFNKVGSEDADWDPYLGIKFVRERQRFLHKIDLMDADGRASEDLGLLFAITANSVAAVFWTLFEVYKRPALLSRVRNIAYTALSARDSESESVLLGKDPLLQSIFAEITRLRVVGIIPRQIVGGDFQLGEWSIPQGSFLGLPSRAGAMNKEYWNSGTSEDPHPLDTFWAERFVVYPDDPDSGPLRKERRLHEKPTPGKEEGKSNEPYFSLKGLKDVYTPFGGGSALCPGRHFARQEVVVTLARLVLHYDIELDVPEDWEPRMDPAFYPTGTLPPLDKVPFRIRKRVL